MPDFETDRFFEMRDKVCGVQFPKHCKFWLTGKCTKADCKLLHEKPAKFAEKVTQPFKNG